MVPFDLELHPRHTDCKLCVDFSMILFGNKTISRIHFIYRNKKESCSRHRHRQTQQFSSIDEAVFTRGGGSMGLETEFWSPPPHCLEFCPDALGFTEITGYKRDFMHGIWGARRANVKKSTQIDDVVHSFYGTGQSPHTTRYWR